MAKIRGKCAACGVPLEVEAPEPFAQAGLVAVCPACASRQFTAAGGVRLQLEQAPEGALFPLGEVAVKGGAVAALAEAGEHAAAFLERHARGDWGAYGRCDEIVLTEEEQRLGWEVTDDSGKINKFNVQTGQGNIMSEYLTSAGKRLWVLTELGGKVKTTVMLPSEY